MTPRYKLRLKFYLMPRLILWYDFLFFFSNCHEWAFCTEKAGSYECECQANLVGDGFECEDIPECDNPNTCHAQATCTEMIGGFACDCNSGYYGDGQNCRDIDECQENANDLQQVIICS